MDCNAYTWTRLASPNSIRLLHLKQARDKQSPLHCTLIEVDLTEKFPPFEAISYACGDYNPNTKLFCDKNNYIDITANLACVLRVFRLPDRDRVLWVDAICINQSDSAEKGHQVAYMLQRIYRSAEKSLVWLGSEDERTARGIYLIREISDDQERYGILNTSPIQEMPIQDQDVQEKQKALNCDENKSMDLSSIFCRSWMSRRWVRQEVVLPHDVEFHCGRHVLSCRTMARAVVVILQLHSTNRLGRFRWIASSHMYSFWSVLTQRYKTLLHQPLFSLLDIHGSTFCRDPRDLVYSLLSLSGDSFAGFKVDYSTDVETAFTGVVHHLLFQEKDIRILHYAGDHNMCRSYVPDWRKKFKNLRFGGFTAQIYFAAGFIQNQSQLPEIMKSEDQLPCIAGWTIGKICKLFPSTGLFGSDGPVPTITTWSREYERAVMGQKYPMTIEDCASAFIRTMVADSRSVITQRYQVAGLTLDDIHATFSAENMELAADSGLLDEDYSRIMLVMDSEWEEETIMEYFKLAIFVVGLPNRCFIILNNHLIGLAPENSKVGDLVCVFAGAETPFVLRLKEPKANDTCASKINDSSVGAGSRSTSGWHERYMLIGECYIHGAMDGEFMGSEGEKRWFQLA